MNLVLVIPAWGTGTKVSEPRSPPIRKVRVAPGWPFFFDDHVEVVCVPPIEALGFELLAAGASRRRTELVGTHIQMGGAPRPLSGMSGSSWNRTKPSKSLVVRRGTVKLSSVYGEVEILPRRLAYVIYNELILPHGL